MLTMPLTMEPPLPVESRPKPQAAAAKVFVVEDDDEMRSLVEEMLREEGYRAAGAPDTFTALLHLLAEGADVLVTDWKMPVMDGLALLDSVRRCMPGLPVVFVTAYADRSLRQRALDRGASSFLAKPFQRDDLLAHVRAALSRRQVRATSGPGRC
ncbi:MAG TPA: response regulator [Candidatus Polarisedimenticolia bacterium]|nr:response regulator [Candidatus Polarisedimenticolia bacterium]